MYTYHLAQTNILNTVVQKLLQQGPRCSIYQVLYVAQSISHHLSLHKTPQADVTEECGERSEGDRDHDHLSPHLGPHLCQHLSACWVEVHALLICDFRRELPTYRAVRLPTTVFDSRPRAERRLTSA